MTADRWVAVAGSLLMGSITLTLATIAVLDRLDGRGTHRKGDPCGRQGTPKRN